MSEANPTAADTDDEIDMVAAFLALFGPEPEPEPQPATINWTPPAPVTWTPCMLILKLLFGDDVIGPSTCRAN